MLQLIRAEFPLANAKPSLLGQFSVAGRERPYQLPASDHFCGPTRRMKNSRLAVAGILMNSPAVRGIVIVIALLGSGWLTKDLALSVNDSVEYWAAARLALHHQNPYDAHSMLAQEQQAGYARRTALEIWNPPWVVPYIIPLAFLPYASAQKLWLLLGCACVALSIYLLWKVYGQTRFPSPAASLAIAIFTPMLLNLAIGQIGPLMLLGVSCFLWFENRRRYALAGASLVLVALKPHLFLLLWLAIIFWSFQQKSGRIVLSFLAMGAAICGLSFAIAPDVFMQYWHFWSHNPVHWNEFPTVSGILSRLTGSPSTAPAFVALVLASVWFLLHWFRVRGGWRWSEELPILLAVSLTASPYAWFFDGVILLPALIQVVQSHSKSGHRLAPSVCYAAANITAVLLIAAGKTRWWYSWAAPVWLLLYFWSRYLVTPKLSETEFHGETGA